MPVIMQLLQGEKDGTISFGNYELTQKTKLQDFEHNGDLYKVKTFSEITKLERNGMFCYESVPGTAVEHYSITDAGVTFKVEGPRDAQITIELEDDTEYMVYINNVNAGKMKTNLSGKLIVSVELSEGVSTDVRIVKQ